MKMNRIDKRYMTFLFLGMLLLTGLPACFLGINTTIDEIGTLASPAWLSGRNWHTAIVSTGGFYYKYGLSLLWTLPFFLIKNPVMLFRSIVTINAVCLSTTPVMAYYIGRHYLYIKKESHAAVIAFVATAIPSTMFHSLYLRGDNILTVMNWVCVLTLLAALYAADKKQKIFRSILLSLVCVYSFSCHSRGIVLVIAIAITVFIMKLFCKKDCVHLLSYLASLVVFLFADRLLQRIFQQAIWQGQQGHATGIHQESFELMLSLQGLKDLIHAMIGWLYNTIVPTGGLFCVSIVACIIVAFHLIRRTGKVNSTEHALTIFGALSFLGSLALGLIFFLPLISENFDMINTTRFDRIVFDRYICSTTEVLCFVAAYMLICRRDLLSIFARAASVLCGVILTMMFARTIAPWFDDGRSFMKRYIGVLNFFLPVKNNKTVISCQDFSSELIGIGILALALLLLFLIFVRFQKIRTFGILFACMSIVFYSFGVRYTLYPEVNNRMGRMEQITNEIAEFEDLYKEYPYIYSAREDYIKTYQVRLINYQIVGPKYQSMSDYDNILFICPKLYKKGKMPDGIVYTIDNFDYQRDSNDILLVKGEHLKAELESRGFTLTLYSNK